MNQEIETEKQKIRNFLGTFDDRVKYVFLTVFDEALSILDSKYKMRFSFSALMLRELAREIWETKGFKPDVAQEEVLKNWPWMKDEVACFREKKGKSVLSTRGKIKASLYGHRTPDEFPNKTNSNFDKQIDELLRLNRGLNTLVHGISHSYSATQEQIIPLLRNVLSNLRQILEIRHELIYVVHASPKAGLQDSASLTVRVSGICEFGRPGDILKEVCMEPQVITSEQLAKKMDLDVAVIRDIIGGQSPITKGIAEKLATIFDFPAEKWLEIQSYWTAKLKR